jgi:hypothetical protein
MVGRAILWLALAVGAAIVAISLGFALFMLGTAAVDGLVSVALRTAVFRAAWDHPQSMIALSLMTAGAIAVLWLVIPAVVRAIRRAGRRKAPDDGESATE